jgi:type IV secretion system protein VirD4
MSKVYFILDEMASLEHLTAIDDAVDKYRGYGVRLICLFQSIGQLRRCFPDGQEQTLLSNTTQVFFGVNDQQTAELVSARLGEETIVVESGGSSRGTSHTWSDGPQRSVSNSTSYNTNENWQQQARKLLKPEEVVALPPRTAITFTPGMPPICTTLLRYYEEKNLGQRPGWLRRLCVACGMFAASAVLCGLSISIAGILTLAAKHPARTIQQQPHRAMPYQQRYPPQRFGSPQSERPDRSIGLYKE